MARQVPVHRLRRNERAWSPPAVLFLDTETKVVASGEREVLGLRLWASALIDSKKRGDATDGWAWSNGTTDHSLADMIDRASRGRPTLWVYAHNLSFDLVTTRLPLLLVKRGWKITDCAVSGRAPWIRMAKGSKHLALTDSWSWLPKSLEAIGEAIEHPKLALPDEADDNAAWLRRCRSDVAILAHAVLELMAWWDRHKLGNWTITGAATGWNAMRHREHEERIVINPDPDGVSFDRKAVYGGRRGVWKVGDLRAGPYLELDFVAAYPTVAAFCALPRKRIRSFASMALDDPAIDHTNFGILADVEICTDVPRWPVRLGGAVWYPTGRFRTTLAGPDIIEARRLGCLVSIGAGWIHQLGYAMSEWAAWCIDVQHNEEPDSPAVARIAAKHWGRAVIGRWAARSFTREQLGPAPTDGWAYEPGWDMHHDRQGGMLDLAGQRWWVVADLDGDNAYPAILAWVEAEVRSRLSRVIEAVGAGCVVQCDTDGLIVAERSLGTRSAHGHLVAPRELRGPARTKWVLDHLDPVTAPLRLRVKRSHGHVTVLGAQHVKLGAQRRFAGLPAGAEETEPNVYQFRAWPKLAWQLGHGDPRGYVRPLLTQKIEGPYPTGWLLQDHRVIAPEAALDRDCATRLLSWPLTGPGQDRPDLAPAQHPYLDGLL